jgi:hypothetical protein
VVVVALGTVVAVEEVDDVLVVDVARVDVVEELVVLVADGAVVAVVVVVVEEVVVLGRVVLVVVAAGIVVDELVVVLVCVVDVELVVVDVATVEVVVVARVVVVVVVVAPPNGTQGPGSVVTWVCGLPAPLFVGVGTRSMKSVALLPVALTRVRLLVSSPAVRAVGVPDGGVPSCVEVLVGPV